MKKTVEKVLRINKETIRTLNSDRLRFAQGGRINESHAGGCEPPNTQPNTQQTDTKTDLTRM
jgi:hypothetical protein